MDAAHNSIEKMLHDTLISAGHLFVSMNKMSKGKFTKQQFDAQFKMRIEVDSQLMTGPDTTQEEFFSSVARMSLCDNCGTLRTGLPKMLTCSDCRGLYYCTKTCQREHWKLAHKTMCTKKLFSKQAYRAANFCGKLLSVLSLGMDPERGVAVNTDDSYLCAALRKHGCKDHVYMPVFQDNTLMYIPMPLKFVVYLVPEKARRATLQTEFSCSTRRVSMALQTQVKDVADATKSVFMMKDTYVILP